jgi:hypothetical protein
MGQAKLRQEKRQRLYESTRGAACVLNPVRPLAAQAFLLVVLVSAPRRGHYDIVDYDALQQTADGLAAHFRQSFPDERFCLVAFPALYSLFGLYDAEEGTLAFETRAQQAVLAAGTDLDTRAWCMERTVVAELDQAVPELQESEAEFDEAVLCYLPVVMIGEEPIIDMYCEAPANLMTGAGRALGQLSESQDLEVGCVGLFPGDSAQRVYESLAGEALATRLALAREAQPRFHLIADRLLLSAGTEVWLGHPAFADLAEEAEDEHEATQWLIEAQRFFAQLRRKLTDHGLTVRTAFLESEEEDASAEQTLQALRSGELASGEDFLIERVESEPVESEPVDRADSERFQLTEYFYEEQFVLGVLSATNATNETDIAFQENLYPCSPTGQEALIAYAEQTARDAGRPLERIRHDGPVLVCHHCFQPVPLIAEGDEAAQPLSHSLH